MVYFLSCLEITIVFVGLLYFLYLAYIMRPSNDVYWHGVYKIICKRVILSSERFTLLNAMLDQLGLSTILLGAIIANFYLLFCLFSMFYGSVSFFAWFYIISTFVVVFSAALFDLFWMYRSVHLHITVRGIYNLCLGFVLYSAFILFLLTLAKQEGIYD